MDFRQVRQQGGIRLYEQLTELENTARITRENLIALLSDQATDEAVFAAADRVRAKYVGDAVHLRGLIEFSNICKQNCCYCGLRRDNPHVRRYRMNESEIMQLAKHAKALGFQTLVLQSGEDDYFTLERLTPIIQGIKKLGFAITLSIGEKSPETYAAYKEAGADRYLLRIETTNRGLYKRFHPGMSFDNRRACLEFLRLAGYEVGTGCLVGLPGQTMADLADDLLFFQAIDADMIGLGPFIPNQDTPLAKADGGCFQLSRKTMALARLLRPDANIPATTAMEALNPQGRILALQSGANVVMPNLTEGDYRNWYALYPGKAGLHDAPENNVAMIKQKIMAIGRTIGQDQGFRGRTSLRPHSGQ